MTRIIHEKFEAGILVSRETEGAEVSYIELAKLCLHLIIAVSIAVIAVLNVFDRLTDSGESEASGISNTTCQSLRIDSCEVDD